MGDKANVAEYTSEDEMLGNGPSPVVIFPSRTLDVPQIYRLFQKRRKLFFVYR